MPLFVRSRVLLQQFLHGLLHPALYGLFHFQQVRMQSPRQEHRVVQHRAMLHQVSPAQPPVLALPTADAAGLRVLRQALDGSGDGGAPTSIPSFWLAVAADAADQARLQALWDLQQAAQPLLWLHEGLDGYRRYLVQQHQLAAHAGRALPRLCGL